MFDCTLFKRWIDSFHSSMPQDCLHRKGRRKASNQNMLTLEDSEPAKWQTNPNIINRKVQVVIVGAGLAGLAAAQRLYELGLQDVIILEAQDRVGGRVHTINHSDHIIELGAQWLHGAYENPLYTWLAEKDMLDHFEKASAGFEGSFYGEEGEILDRDFIDKVLNILITFKTALFNDKSRTMVNLSNSQQSISKILRRLLKAEVERRPDLKSRQELVDAIFEWFLKFETIENGCDSMDDVSISSYADWTDLGDGSLLNFKHGYSSLLQWFCSQIPTRKWVYLNHRVESIEVLSKKGEDNNLSWVDGNGNEYFSPILIGVSKSQLKSRAEFIECHHIIMTASLGVLKATHETLFRPQLPETKCALIERLGFGTVNKIVMQFETPFWADEHGIKLIWEKSHKKEEKWPSWVYDILSFDVVRRQKNLLIGWIGGEGAKLMEIETDEEVGSVCIQVLKKFLSESSFKPSRLLSCRCSRWNSNPDTRGSYSFQSVNSLGLNLDKLHEPIYNTDLDNDQISSFKLNRSAYNNMLTSASSLRVPRIMFAGEATAGELYSTTHGAILSGWREADRLGDHLSGCNKVVNSSRI